MPREQTTVLSQDLATVIEGLQRAMVRIAAHMMRTAESRRRISEIAHQPLDDPLTHVEVLLREKHAWEDLWREAEDTLAETLGHLTVDEQWLRAMAQGMTIAESMSTETPRPFDATRAALEQSKGGVQA